MIFVSLIKNREIKKNKFHWIQLKSNFKIITIRKIFRLKIIIFLEVKIIIFKKKNNI
jgi:hypothetical protein